MELRPPKIPERRRNKGSTKPSKIVTTKKIVPLLLGPTLLLQRKRLVRIGSKARTEMFLRLFAIDAIRKNIIQGNVLSQKTSCSFGNFHIDNR